MIPSLGRVSVGAKTITPHRWFPPSSSLATFWQLFRTVSAPRRKISFSDELSVAVAIITVAFNCTLDQRKHFHAHYTRVLVNGITGDRCIESESLPFGDSERKNHDVKALRRDE